MEANSKTMHTQYAHIPPEQNTWQDPSKNDLPNE